MSRQPNTLISKLISNTQPPSRANLKDKTNMNGFTIKKIVDGLTSKANLSLVGQVSRFLQLGLDVSDEIK